MIFGAFQNFKDRFRARPRGPLEGFVVSAYGKLPIYKDYILWECAQGGAAEFKRWLDESFGMGWEEFDGKGVTLRGPARALLLLPGGRHAVAVAIWPSTDEGGLRKFPFSVFAVFARSEIVGRGVRGAIEALLPVWRSLERQYAAMRECRSVEELYGYMQRAVPALEPAEAAESDPDLGAWFDTLDATHGPGTGAEINRRVRATLTAYRSFPEQGESLAVRLPLAAGIDVAAQAALWVEAFQANLKKIPPFPSFVLEMEPDGASPRGLVLCWRDLRREDARLFGEKIDAYEFVEDLLDGLPSAAPTDAEPPPREAEAWLAWLGRA